MAYNASDRKQVREAEKSARLADQNRGAVIADLASRESGRRYLWDRIAEAGVFASTYHDNPQRMAFAEGQRTVGLALLNDFMHYAPDNFIQAMRESNGRRTESDTRADARTSSGSSTDPAAEHSGIAEPGWEPEEPSGSEARADIEA